jgi:hypothetical protein
LVGNPERERPFGRPEPGCEKMSAEDLNWIHFTQYRNKYWALVNTVMNFRVA